MAVHLVGVTSLQKLIAILQFASGVQCSITADR